ncbi:MAG: TRAP transporter small permease [Desulfobacterales bacterium]|nr:TRAP transporter small permease [Desulfobacterales bacterium]
MLERFCNAASRYLVVAGGVFLVAMMGLTCGNILFRLVWVPIRGTFELMGFFGAVVAAFALGYTQLRRGHIAVDVLVNTFSDRTRLLLVRINSLLCAVFFAVVAWQLAEKGHVLRLTEEVTETLRVIYYPFVYGVALGFAFLALVFMLDLLRTLRPAAGGGH